METAKQNTQQNIEENDALKQFMGLLNRQGMGEQSQDFMELFQYVAWYAATACRDDRRAAGCQGAALTVAGKPAQNGHREPCG